MGAESPYPMESATVTGSAVLLLKENTEQTWAYKLNENAHKADVQED